jgi:dimethylamine/trimethylamine dehydrogenase
MRRVHIVDAEDEMGGHICWLSGLPRLGQWARVVDYRKIQINKLPNVEFVPNSRLDASDVAEYGAEIVIVATGSRWASDGLNGVTHAGVPGADASHPHVLTPEQVTVGGKDIPGDRVIIYDTDGYVLAPSLAERLVADGHHVEFVTPLSQVAPLCDETLEGVHVRGNLHDLGVVLRRSTVLTAVQPDRAFATSEFGEPLEISADAILLVTQRLSDDALYLELSADEELLASNGIGALYRIGDCVAPRLLSDIVFDGHRLAREIDSENPALAKSYLREYLTPEQAPRVA